MLIMVQEEIIEGNKLIAEFVGMQETNISNYFGTTSDEFLDRFTIAAVPYDEVHFESSWDWLMPVIEKIESMDIRGNGYDFPKVKLNGDSCEIFAYATYRGTTYYWKKWIDISQNFHFHNNHCETKIEAVWKAAVEFIKWYNSCQKEK